MPTLSASLSASVFFGFLCKPPQSRTLNKVNDGGCQQEGRKQKAKQDGIDLIVRKAGEIGHIDDKVCTVGIDGKPGS
jgi:hypothetical protein